MKKFFDALKTAYAHKSSRTTPLLSADGTSLLTDKEAILKRWAEHFNVVHHLSMMKLSTENHRWNVIHCLTSSSRLWNIESNKTPFIWQGSRIGCNTCRDLQSRRSSSCRETDSYFTLYGEKKPSLKNSRMFQLSTYSKGKRILKSVESPRHLFIVNCWEVLAIVLLNRLNEHLEQSGLLPESRSGVRGQLQRNARNRTWISIWALSTLQEHLIQSVARVFRKIWQSLAVLPNS